MLPVVVFTKDTERLLLFRKGSLSLAFYQLEMSQCLPSFRLQSPCSIQKSVHLNSSFFGTRWVLRLCAEDLHPCQRRDLEKHLSTEPNLNRQTPCLYSAEFWVLFTDFHSVLQSINFSTVHKQHSCTMGFGVLFPPLFSGQIKACFQYMGGWPGQGEWAERRWEKGYVRILLTLFYSILITGKNL